MLYCAYTIPLLDDLAKEVRRALAGFKRADELGCVKLPSIEVGLPVLFSIHSPKVVTAFDLDKIHLPHLTSPVIFWSVEIYSKHLFEQ